MIKDLQIILTLLVKNDLNQSLRYYLRLISNHEQFLINCTEQIATDADIKGEPRELWSQILARLES